MVPSQFAPYVNPVDRKSFWTAETHSYFLMHLGPIILRDRLPRPYYLHFLAISEITKKVVQIEITSEEIDQLERDLLKWVRDFEKLYYGWDIKYISSCTTPLHALLHVAECIRKQGPAGKYWCFAMERYGGWVKRWAKSNRKQVITAMTNIIIKEERIHQLSMMCNTAQLKESNAWWDQMRGKTAAYIATYSETSNNNANFTPGKLMEVISAEYPLDDRTYRAVKTHLQTRAYTDEGWQARQASGVDDETLRATSFTAWKAYHADSDKGSQRYRNASHETQQSNLRSSSWPTYTQFVDKGAHTRRPNAEWTKIQQWGEIILFLTFKWERQPIAVAVIQAYRTVDWIRGILNPSQELGAIDSTMLQVVELNALDDVAGRVSLVRNGRRKTVIFETSGGVLRSQD